MTIDIASLGVRIDSDGVERGVEELDNLVVSAEKAEGAERDLEQQSRKTSAALAEAASSAADASRGVDALGISTSELAEAEEQAQVRIKEMVRQSLAQQQAWVATANAARGVAQATDEVQRSVANVRIDQLGNAFAEAQAELDAFNDAMSNQAQSLDDIGERQEWLNGLYDRGLLSFADMTDATKRLEKQERELRNAMADQAREVQNLLRQYDPASAALRKIEADELRLQEAFRAGAITAQQYQKATAGLVVNRARWQAEAAGVQETAKQVNLLGLTSAAAFRDYSTFVTAVGTGQYGLASRQILQLGIRTNALRAALTPLGIAAGASAAVIGVLAVAAFKAQKETFDLEKSIILSGNAAGVTAGQIALMAESIDDIVGTRAAATATLSALAASGRVAAKDLQEFTIVAQQLERAAGQPAEETIKILTELGREPVEASRRLNESLHFLTKEIYDQIVAAQKRGDIEEAAALAQRAYAQEFKRRARDVDDAMPGLQRGAKATASAFKEMWDAVTGVFVGEAPEQRLKKLQDARGDRELFTGRAAFNRDTEEQQLTAVVEQRRREAAQQRESAKEVERAERARIESVQRLQRERSVGDALSASRASAIQRELANDLSQYSAYQSELQALREARLIDEADYYSERRKLIEQHRDVQIAALQDENRRIAADSARAQGLAKQEAANATTAAEAQKAEAAAQTTVIANQTKISDNESKIAQLRDEAIAELRVLTIEQEAAGEAITRSYEDARAAAQRYLDVITKQQQRELEGLGRGPRQRQIDSSRGDIDERFSEQRNDLAGELRKREITRAEYDQQLEIIDEFHQKALEANDRYYEQLDEKQGSWLVGVQEAFATLRDQSRDAASLAADAVTNAFQAMEDALVQFAQTGKLDFKSLANSIIADLIRIQLRAAISGSGGLLSLLGDAIGGLFGPKATAGGGAGGGNFSGPRAAGGPVEAGGTYLVGERGPELITPRSAGMVVPNSMLRGGPNVTINQHLYPAPGTDNAQFHAMMEQAKAEVRAEIFEDIRSKRWERAFA